MVTVRKTRSDHVRENRRPDTKCEGTQEASLDQGGGKGRRASSVGGRRGRRKTRLDREAEQTFGPFGGQKDRAGRDRYPAGSPQRTEGGSGLSLPEFLVHGPWPRHQSAGARLGKDAYRHSTRDFSALVRLPEAPRLSHQIPDRRFFRRRTRRYLHRHRVGRLMPKNEMTSRNARPMRGSYASSRSSSVICNNGSRRRSCGPSSCSKAAMPPARAAPSRRSPRRSARACSGSSPFPLLPIGTRPRSSSSATSSISRPEAKSSSSTAAGTTVPASSMSWASVRLTSIGAS